LRGALGALGLQRAAAAERSAIDQQTAHGSADDRQVANTRTPRCEPCFMTAVQFSSRRYDIVLTRGYAIVSPRFRSLSVTMSVCLSVTCIAGRSVLHRNDCTRDSSAPRHFGTIQVGPKCPGILAPVPKHLKCLGSELS